jgi:hypothetical protein
MATEYISDKGLGSAFARKPLKYSKYTWRDRSRWVNVPHFEYFLFRFPQGSGRSAAYFSSDAAKRRSSRLIREKVQEQGAFISRVTDRVTISESVGNAPRPRSLGDKVMMMDVNLKAEHERERRDQRNVQHHSGTQMGE